MDTSLSAIEQDTNTAAYTEQARSFVKAYAEEAYPKLDLRAGGVLSSIFVNPIAEVVALANVNAERVLAGTSLYGIIESGETASTEDVDRVISNFLLTRKEGGTATGYVTIFVSNDETFVIPKGTTFVAGDYSFTTSSVYVATAGSVVNATDRQIISRGNDSWSVTIPVTAASAGSSYMVEKGASFTWSDAPTQFVSAEAASDVANGSDEETNKALLARLDQGITAKVMGGRQNITAMISELYPNVQALSIIGSGDREMRRDGHNLLGIKTGSKFDIYARTAATFSTNTITKSAVLLNTDSKLLQISLGRDDYPGFYMVQAVNAVSSTASGTLEISFQARACDTTNLDYPAPAMQGTESGFTRFQTEVLQFTDPNLDVSSLAAGDTVEYEVEVVGIPNIADIQNTVSDRSKRAPAGDVLVRAPHPMFVAVSLTVLAVKTEETPDTDGIKAAVAAALNGIAFDRPGVPASLVIQAAQSVLTGRAVVKSPVSMAAILVMPDGSTQRVSDRHLLAIPTLDQYSVSPRTVGVYSNASMVAVDVELVDALPV